MGIFTTEWQVVALFGAAFTLCIICIMLAYVRTRGKRLHESAKSNILMQAQRDDLSVFISYARSDGSNAAQRLYEALKGRQILAWYDRRHLDPTRDFTSALEQAIEHSSHVIVCLTPGSKHPDSFVRREIQYALIVKKPIIVVRFADIAPHIHTATNTWIDAFQGRWDKALDQLLHWLRRPERSYESASDESTDPFKWHLETLARFVVGELQQSVLNADILPLLVSETPDAVARLVPAAYISRQPILFHQQHQSHMFNDFWEAFESFNERVLLLGEPGAGKTTTLLALTRDKVNERLDNPAALLPIYAPIRTWNGKATLPVWLASITGIDNGQLEEQIKSGRVLILLDGLDELRSAFTDPNDDTGKRQDLRVEFVSLLASMKPTPMIVTCRSKDYEDIIQGEGQKLTLDGAISLNPLTDTQIADYLHEQPELQEAVHADATLRDMVRTPLVLSLLALAYQGQGERARELRDLSHSPVAVRDRIFETYVEKRYSFEQSHYLVSAQENEDSDSDGGSHIPFSLAQIHEILGKAAILGLWDEDVDGSNIPIVAFCELLGNSTDFFLDFVNRLHLLLPARELVYGRTRWHFSHLLLRDYFAISSALKHLNDPGFQVKAVRALGRIGDGRAVEPLIRLLDSEDVSLQAEVAKALGHIGDARAVESLISALDQAMTSNQKTWFCLQILSALGGIDDPRTMEPLIQAMHSNEFGYVVAGTMALSRKRTPRATRILIHAMNGDGGFEDNFLAQIVAVNALSMATYRGQEEAREALLTAVEQQNPIALKMLGMFPNLDNRFLQPIVAALRSEDPTIRAALAKALGDIRNPHTITSLVALLHDPDADVRESAARALTEFDAEQVIQPLLGVLEVEDDNSCQIAIQLLASIGKPAIPPLIDRLISSHEYTEHAALSALRMMQTDDTLKIIARALNDPREDVRFAVLPAIIQYRERSLPYIKEALNDPNESVRTRAMACLLALGRMGMPLLMDALYQDEDGILAFLADLIQYTDESTLVAMHVRDFLAAIRAEGFGSKLKAILWERGIEEVDLESEAEITEEQLTEKNHTSSEEQPNINSKTSFELRRLVDRLAMSIQEVLIEGLHDRNASGVARGALVYMGADSVNALMTALHDGDNNVDQVVLEILAGLVLSGGRLGEGVAGLLAHEAPETQMAVAKLVGAASKRTTLDRLADLRRSQKKYEDEERSGEDRLNNARLLPLIVRLGVELLSNESAVMRRFALDILAHVPNRAVVIQVIPLLDDADDDVAMRAAVTLGRIGDIQAKDALTKLTLSDREGPRGAAMIGLDMLEYASEIPSP